MYRNYIYVYTYKECHVFLLFASLNLKSSRKFLIIISYPMKNGKSEPLIVSLHFFLDNSQY